MQGGMKIGVFRPKIALFRKRYKIRP